MINFSKVDTKENLIAAIDALPEETSSASKELVTAGKANAKLLLATVKTNGASLNLRINQIGDNFSQSECQVAGQSIVPKTEAK